MTMEDNKLIAEFMSIKYDADDETFHTNEGWKGVDYLMYHTSWDWLMPVISKIVEDYGEGWSFEEGYDLEVRYQAVVNFIKECNDEKN